MQAFQLFGVAMLLIGCSSSGKLPKYQEPVALRERAKWFAHCETCNWCKGSYKNTQEVQRLVTEHNKEKHDWFKVAYYDQTPCGK